MKLLAKSRLPILALLTLLVVAPQTGQAGKGDDLPAPTSSNAVRVSHPAVCNESTLRFLVDEDRDYVFLWRPASSKWWRLEEHVLRVGYGSSLTSIQYEFTVAQLGAWTLEVLNPDSEAPQLVPPNPTGMLVYAIGRPPETGPLASHEFTVVPSAFNMIGGGDPIVPASLPDLVIEPQTGCPEDVGVILGPVDD